MGLRSKIKGRLKAALKGEPKVESASKPTESPIDKHMVSISEDTGGGNLRDVDDDVPWYLKYDDADGWESTNAKDDVDGD